MYDSLNHHNPVREIPPHSLLPVALHAQADALAELRSEHAAMSRAHREAFNPTTRKAAEEADRRALLSAEDPANHPTHANANTYNVQEARSAEALKVKTAELAKANAEWRTALLDNVVERWELADAMIDPAADEYRAAIDALAAARAKYTQVRAVVGSISIEADLEAHERREHGQRYTNDDGRFYQYASRPVPRGARGLRTIPAAPQFDQVIVGLYGDADPGGPAPRESASVDEFLRYVEANRYHNGSDSAGWEASRFDKFVWLPAKRSELPAPVTEPEPEPIEDEDDPEFDDQPTPATERGTARRGRRNGRNVVVIPPGDFR